MKKNGVIIDMSNRGYIVELENGEVGLLPIGDTTCYRYADTLLDRKVEVYIKNDTDDILVLDNRFKLVSQT